ncbi:MAG TPA: SOS response-associated peptidase family protein [Kofleriaceae bacterium]|nr:SOS response-associated peptidase family protein [Kofleriaceae bacterium]
MARHEPRFTLTTLEGLGTLVDEPPRVLAEGSSTTIAADLPVVRYNVAPGQDAWVVRPGAGDGVPTRQLAKLRWGLLPRWQGHGGKRPAMVHAAPLEAVAATPLLRDAFKKQRCLVLADGCYAWNALKQPVWFHPEPVRVIALAGVWATNKDDGVASFALLTGEPLVTRVSEPMPIVLDESCYDVWLSGAPDAAMSLCAPRALDGWRADPVTTWMASADHDDPKCIEPVGNPRQGELF